MPRQAMALRGQHKFEFRKPRKLDGVRQVRTMHGAGDQHHLLTEQGLRVERQARARFVDQRGVELSA